MGARRFLDVGSVGLELGGRLDHVRVAYETWGTPDADLSNAVLVLHALTGDSHVVGAAGPGHPTPGWWDGLIGPGAAIDTGSWYVVAPNVLGGCQGTHRPVLAHPRRTARTALASRASRSATRSRSRRRSPSARASGAGLP